MTPAQVERLRADIERRTRDIRFARVGIAVGKQLASRQQSESGMPGPTHGGRAVKRMVNLLDGFNRELEKHVEDTLAKAVAPKLDNVKTAVTNLGQKVGKAFDEAAQHADDYVSQLTNGEDPLESEPPSGG